MARAVVGGVWAPLLPGFVGSTNNTSQLIDAAGEKYAMIVQVPKAGTITKVAFRFNTVTTGQTLKVGIYTVDASGNPTTTAYGSMVVGTTTVANADDNRAREVTLGTGATAVRGDIIAIVIEWNATVGTINFSETSARVSGFPYCALYTTAWAKSQNVPMLTLGYSDDTYPPIIGVSPFLGLTTGGDANVVLSHNSGTASFDEYGVKFTAPFDCAVVGLQTNIGMTAAGSAAINVYDGTTLLSAPSIAAWDHDWRSAAGSAPCAYLFREAVLMKRGEVRYFAIQPTTAVNISTWLHSVHAAAVMEAACGSVLKQVKRLNAGAWTEVDGMTDIAPLLSQVDDGGFFGARATLVGGPL